MSKKKSIVLPNGYEPNPTDLSGIELSEELNVLTEEIAEEVHDKWAVDRMSEGYTYGEYNSDVEGNKKSSFLLPYNLLPDTHRYADRKNVLQTLKLIQDRGYVIKQKDYDTDANGEVSFFISLRICTIHAL
ncbi:MAG: Ryanodine receptor Ryr [Clostridia bacterium]|nr:Ryanodine receptor Ryr [Clostridia bacterium]